MDALEPHRQKQLPNVKLFSNLSVFAVTDPYVVLQGYESLDVEVPDAKVLVSRDQCINGIVSG